VTVEERARFGPQVDRNPSDVMLERMEEHQRSLLRALAVVVSRNEALEQNLTAVQVRCNELLEEVRVLRGVLKDAAKLPPGS
jgi:tRNA C32,U32 (ribose-2'-O)-methylase TrmJ